MHFNRRFNRLSKEEKETFRIELMKLENYILRHIPNYPAGLTISEIAQKDEAELQRIRELDRQRQALVEQYLNQHQEIYWKVRELLSEHNKIIGEMVSKADIIEEVGSGTYVSPKIPLYLSMIGGLVLIALGFYNVSYSFDDFTILMGYIVLIGGFILIVVGIFGFKRIKRLQKHSTQTTSSSQKNNQCATCKRPLRFISPSQKWYCDTCKRYV